MGVNIFKVRMKQTIQRIYPYIKEGRFYNYPNEVPEGFLLRSIYIYFKSFINRCFYHPQVADWQMKATIETRSLRPMITWIGHSTFLIQIAGVNILTDPIFGDATSLFPRILKPGIELMQLPPIDYVLISHNHLDHMDAQALVVLKEQHPHCRYLVPLCDKKWFDKRQFTHVSEYTWWQQEHYCTPSGADIKLTFLPAFHWSQRGLFDKNKSLWGSWMIEVDNRKIYFAGDTAYSRHFKLIGQEFSNIDCAIMPIGPCDPHKWMKFSHTNAQEAYEGFRDLGAHHFIPMHWGTFYFGTDTFDTSMNLLQGVWEEHHANHPKKQLHILRAGQTIDLPTIPADQLVQADQTIQM